MKTITKTEIETGVMAILDDKAWGKDPYCDNGANDWVDIIGGRIGNPEFAKTTQSFTYQTDYRRKELATAKLVKATRTVVTTLEIEDEQIL